jgi:DNA-binding NarL/FixJ family response regulator
MLRLVHGCRRWVFLRFRESPGFMSAIRFLVADSSPAIQTFLRQLLEGYGFEPAWIKTTSTPQAALEVAAEHQPHVLLTDCYSKDGVTGLALHQKLLKLNPQCRFGLMSAHMDPTMAEHAQRAGALFQLAKPFTAIAIKGAVAKAMEQLAHIHPQVAHKLQPAAARPVLPPLPKFQAGDAVLYQGRYETVKDVIFRQGELVVHLQGTPGMVPATKISKL